MCWSNCRKRETSLRVEFETGARNDLKTRAAALGGNVVVLLTQRGVQSGSFDGTDGGYLRQTGVTLTGSVYRCPGAGA